MNPYFSVLLAAALLSLNLLQPQALAQEAAAPSTSEAQTSSIGISLFEFQNKKGVAMVALYDSKDAWNEPAKAHRKAIRKIKGKSMWVEFKDLKPGTYAISVFHDENKNNKMDMKWLPYPRPGEGVGCSNNYKGRPKWKHAKFKLTPGKKTMKIRLRYF